MEATTCLICNESVTGPGGSKGGAQKKAKNNETPPQHPQLLSDAKSKFALTSVQYVILQKVLSLPEGTCRGELMGGPYCRECFTNINNVCHIMSALENLQESIQEFRKDFGAKMSSSLGGGDHQETFTSSGRKRRSVSTNNNSNDKWNKVRKILLDCLNRHTFVLGNIGSGVSVGVGNNFSHSKQSPGSNKAKHLHDIISEFDPDCRPETNVKADLVLRTTNGNMPVLSRTKKLTHKAQSLQKDKKKVVQASPSSKLKSSNSSSSSNIGKAFVCRHESCDEKFPTLSALNVHRERAHLVTQTQDSGSGDYVCWYCNKEFRSDNELKIHEREHTTSRKCPICHKVFGRVNYLNLHMMSHSTTATPVAPSKKKNSAKSSQDTLVKEKSSNRANKLKLNWPKCDVCCKVFPNKKMMVSHRLKEHHRSSDTPGPGAVSKAKLVVIQAKGNVAKVVRPARCKICVKIVMDLSSHMKSVHPEVALVNGNKDKTANGSTLTSKTGSNSSVPSTSKTIKPGPASWKKNVKEEQPESSRSREKEDKAEVKPHLNSKDAETKPNINVEKDTTSGPESKSKESKTLQKVKTECADRKNSITEVKNSKVKTEDDNESACDTTIKKEKESPPVKKGLISTANCLLPASLPSSSANKTQGSKYQFKNLLKIGEDKV